MSTAQCQYRSHNCLFPCLQTNSELLQKTRIIHPLVNDSTARQSIVQAVKSARSTSFWWYFRVLAAIVFFGGFFLKSLIDDQTRKHDVKKVLAYYKHVAPGTINDGDERNAQYLCWKYKGKKDKLWKRLETKYDTPMRELHEWEDEEDEEDTGANKKVEEEEDEVDLDEDSMKGDL